MNEVSGEGLDRVQSGRQKGLSGDRQGSWNRNSLTEKERKANVSQREETMTGPPGLSSDVLLATHSARWIELHQTSS